MLGRLVRRVVPPKLALLVAALASAGCDVEVGAPQRLWLLWLTPAVAVLLLLAAHAQRRALSSLVSDRLSKRLVAPAPAGQAFLSRFLVLVAIAACVLALARLRYGYAWEEVRRRGVDIVIALDVSDSMLVEDAEAGGKLSRLERAKREIRDLLPALKGDRVALVAFAGAAFVQSPLTLDYGATQMFLTALRPDEVPVKGTALGEALRVSLGAFRGGTEESRAVLLITDGEDLTGDAAAAAREAEQAGVRVFAIGIGRDEGAPVPASGGGFRRDAAGELVLSRLDEATLKQITSATGGRYTRSVTGDVDLQEIYEKGIRATVPTSEGEVSKEKRPLERFQALLAFALACLAVEALLPRRRRTVEAAS